MRDVETQTMSRHVPVSTQSEIRGFGRYIVYVDESGDHNLDKVDTNYPIFVLAFCVFDKKHYCEHVICELQRFKFRHMGHDLIGLHELDIRKEKGQFSGVFRSRQHKQVFLDELTDVIEKSRFVLICCVVDKRTLALTHGVADNPYHLALGACMQTLHEFLQEKKQHDALTHVVFEKRGKKEDNELELEFRRQCDGANPLGISMPFDIVFASKQVNSTGLQFADLVARPVGLSVLRPWQENRAFEVLRKKFYCSGGRENTGIGFENRGLRIFPCPESEKPR